MTTTDSAPAIDEANVEAFVGKILTDVGGTSCTMPLIRGACCERSGRR
jgi:hypothetical protein